MLTFAVRLILEKDGKQLFLHQTKKNGGNFSLVGGTVEEREFAREALCREAMEEAGISVKPHDLELIHVLHRHKLKKNEQYLVLYFKALNFVGEPEPLERKKFKDVAWFELNHLPPDLSKGTRHALESIRKGELYSEFPSRNKVLHFWQMMGNAWAPRLPDF